MSASIEGMFGQVNPRHVDLPSLRAVEPGDEFLWCVLCERAFRKHRYRLDGGPALCPYDGCDGGRLFEPWAWSRVRGANPDYPSLPLEDVAYPYVGKPGARHRED